MSDHSGITFVALFLSSANEPSEMNNLDLVKKTRILRGYLYKCSYSLRRLRLDTPFFKIWG